MSLTTSDMSVADLAAVTGTDRNGWGGDGAWWLLILFLFMFNGNWGNGFGGGMNNGTPYVVSDVQRGFDQSAIMNGITGISNAVTSGFGDIQTALCGGFAGVNAGIANGFAQAEIADNSRQMANMNQMFGIQSALQQCCCDNRASIADLKYTVATENCADRAAVSDGIRDVIASNTANTQAILDKLCALELDGYKRENDNLRTQLNMASLNASQAAQTAELRNSQATTANQLISELRSCPIPAQPVYGSQPIFTCGGNNSGCGCGCGM